MGYSFTLLHYRCVDTDDNLWFGFSIKERSIIFKRLNLDQNKLITNYYHTFCIIYCYIEQNKNVNIREENYIISGMRD